LKTWVRKHGLRICASSPVIEQALRQALVDHPRASNFSKEMRDNVVDMIMNREPPQAMAKMVITNGSSHVAIEFDSRPVAGTDVERAP
jgi:hypothetical protein